tara:strand:+ start:2029 stop:2220 length:192 start_codon:yes stop_codon:yes gene_type:complete
MKKSLNADAALSEVIAAILDGGLIFQEQPDEVRRLMHTATRYIRVWTEAVSGPGRIYDTRWVA